MNNVYPNGEQNQEDIIVLYEICKLYDQENGETRGITLYLMV